MTKLEVIRENLIDMLGIEQSLLQRIERHLREGRAKKYYRAFEMLEKIRGVIILHICQLEGHLSSVDGGIETKLKKTAASLVGSMTYLYEKFRTNEPVSRNLRDDYTLLNHAVISYSILHTAMLAFKEEEIAEMSRHHMSELAQLVVELSEVIPFVLANELSEEVEISGEQSVAQQAVAQYREAWTHRVEM